MFVVEVDRLWDRWDRIEVESRGRGPGASGVGASAGPVALLSAVPVAPGTILKRPKS